MVLVISIAFYTQISLCIWVYIGRVRLKPHNNIRLAQLCTSRNALVHIFAPHTEPSCCTKP